MSPTAGVVDEINPDRLRKALLDRDIVTGWQGLTQGLAARLSRRVASNGATGDPEAAVAFTPANVATLLKSVMGLENEIWRELTKSVERRDSEEAEEKKI